MITMGDFLQIGRRIWNVKIIALSESFNILYSENTGRTMAIGAPLVLDPLGTFYGHTITVKRDKLAIDEYDELFDYISQPRYDGIDVKIVHNQSTINYKAYFAPGKRDLIKIDTKTRIIYWDSYEINIIPIQAQVTP